jgi:hypothetical protein
VLSIVLISTCSGESQGDVCASSRLKITISHFNKLDHDHDGFMDEKEIADAVRERGKMNECKFPVESMDQRLLVPTYGSNLCIKG